MTGAELILRTLSANGVEVCFTNPGTSEMAFVQAAESVREVRMVLALFEGVASGAADGFARIAERPAATLLHLGPGFANAMANLHNARRARSPLVNLVGDHATYHLALDAPLASELPAIAAAFSVWSKTCAPHRVSSHAAEAVAAAIERQGPASLIVPADVAWSPSAESLSRKPPRPRREATPDAIAEVARRLHAAREKALILLSGNALSERGARAAAAIAEHTGATLVSGTFNAKSARGRGRPLLPKLPYFAEQASELLGRFELAVLAGAAYPVSFFAYPGKPSLLPPDTCAVLDLAAPEENAEAALLAVADELGASRALRKAPEMPLFELPSGALTPETIARSIARHLPENAIVSEEAGTSSPLLIPTLQGAAPHDWLDLTGGSIGQAIPVATGAAVAAPDRRVVCLTGDGGAMYTIQGLWTQAREQLNVVTVVYANRAYRILNVEYGRISGRRPEARAQALLEIDRPTLDFVALARGLGVAAERAESAERFDALLASALATPGPMLIEAMI